MREPLKMYVTQLFVDGLREIRPERMSEENFDKWVAENCVIVEPLPEE